MTLALAASCIDGVVIVEDRALTRMDTFELLRYDEKLCGVIRNVIFGYAGNESLYDIFVKYVVGELVMLRDDEQKYTRINMLPKFCRIINTLRSIVSSFKLKILVARQYPNDGKSDLHLLLESGKVESIESYKNIGDAADIIADDLVNNFWRSKEVLRMRDFAKLGHCIIKFIEKEELAIGVGVGHGNPSIRYLEHGADIDVSPTQEEFSSFTNCYESYYAQFREILGSNYFNLKESTRQFKERFRVGS